VCTLPPSDWEVIVSMVSLKELFGSLDSLKATLETVEGCVEFYKWLMKRGIIKIAGKIDDGAKKIWHEISSWW
jgi:hypothetical protein